MEKRCTAIHCPVSNTLKLIGGKYKALILWHLMSGTLRYGELHKLIPQATPKMLTQQLRELEGDALLSRVIYPEVPPKVEYTLTPLGESLMPILTAMYHWGTDYLHTQGLTPSCSMRQPDQATCGSARITSQCDAR